MHDGKLDLAVAATTADGTGSLLLAMAMAPSNRRKTSQWVSAITGLVDGGLEWR